MKWSSMNEHWQNFKKDIGRKKKLMSGKFTTDAIYTKFTNRKPKQRGNDIDFVRQTGTPLFTNNDTL